MVESMDNFELSSPLDLTHHYSATTRQRQPSSIKAFYKYFQIPGIANLAGGLPDPKYFPFDTLEAKSALPQRFKPTPNTPVDPPVEAIKGKHSTYLNEPTQKQVTVPHVSHQPNVLQRIDLNTALQYGTAQGYPPLYSFIREFALTRLNPNIPYKNGAEVILTCGNTDGFNKVIDCFVNPWSPESGRPVSEREGLLVEEFAYSLAIATARPRGMNIVPIAIDAEGMLAYGHPKCLYNVLSDWNVERDGSKRPHLMYTVTMGQNPTSGLLSVKRRKEIYEVCQKFDILIVEDDPYFYIQFPHAANEFMQQNRDGKLLSVNHFAESNLNHQTSLRVPVRGTVTSGTPHQSTRMRRGKSSGSDFLDSLVPSYLSIDIDGRVVRLDTFSKTVAPGCRLGWITAQPEFIDRILRITETSTQQPSGFVQSLLAEMLIGPDHADLLKNSSKSDRTAAVGWKVEGWIRWLAGLRGNYERRMRIMCDVLEKGKFITTSHASVGNSENGFLEGMDPISSYRSHVRKHRALRVAPYSRDTVFSCAYARDQGRPAMSCLPLRTQRQEDEAGHAENDDSFEVLRKLQIYDFNPPMAGMFLWLRVGLESHPLFHSFAPERLSFAFWILLTHKPYLTLVAPGSMFSSSEQIRKERGWAYYRICFAAVDDDEIKAISERFVQGCHAFFEITDADEIQRLLDEGENHGLETALKNLPLEEQARFGVNPGMC